MGSGQMICGSGVLQAAVNETRVIAAANVRRIAAEVRASESTDLRELTTTRIGILHGDDLLLGERQRCAAVGLLAHEIPLRLGLRVTVETVATERVDDLIGATIEDLGPL